MRVFVDTNVWLAGRFGRGLCSDLLDLLVLEDVEIVLDERVCEEFRRIATEKFGVDLATLNAADVFFERHARIVDAARQQTPGVPDPDDAWIIRAAIEHKADLFVTGDKALLALERIEGLDIVDPRALFVLLRAPQSGA